VLFVNVFGNFYTINVHQTVSQNFVMSSYKETKVFPIPMCSLAEKYICICIYINTFREKKTTSFHIHVNVNINI